jgi:hypothetical protein
MEALKWQKAIIRFISLTILCLMGLVMGCSPTREGIPQWSGSGFLRKEFLNYKRVAVLPFEGDPQGEVSDTFARSFRGRFPQTTIVGRRQVRERFHEQDLYYGRLDKETRTEIGKTFDVQAIVMGSVYYPSIVSWILQIIVVDTETNEVLGRSYVEINFMGAEGKDKGCDLAVEQLILR